MSKHFLDNLEIYLTCAGLIVIFGAATVLRAYGYWQILAIA